MAGKKNHETGDTAAQSPARADPDNLAFARQQIEAAARTQADFLTLSGLALTDIPQEVFELSHLKRLYLRGNRLKTVPERLWALPKLERIVLYENPIESLPNRPGLAIDGHTYRACRPHLDPRNIDSLLISNRTPFDEATFWINELRQMTTLRDLTLGGWGPAGSGTPAAGPALNAIIRSLDEYTGLHSLVLRGIYVPKVPAVLRKLTQLRRLDLSNVGLRVLPDWIGELDLEGFAAFGNKLAALPNGFGRLARLERLDLSHNPLGRIPECVFDLGLLKGLVVIGCGIHAIPSDILRLERLQTLDCNDNPIESPPAEVAGKGISAVRDYWRQRADTGVDYLCEAKLIILGEPGAGKTSLARMLQQPTYEISDEKSTEGIDVLPYRFPTAITVRDNGTEKSLQREFHVNIWDFGGQEIYHATHQFFLTRRSVYVLVCDDRKEDTDFAYWLQIVELLSDGSPLLIVQNEKQDRSRDINLSNLRARFANVRASFATNLATKRGLEHLVQGIRHELTALPHIGVGLPATWKRVREALEKDKRDHIPLEEYLAICQQHGFTRREDKLQLSGYLHDLGICLHFQDDPLLKNTVILKPAWGTDAVYHVLDDRAVVAQNGRFTRGELERIWSDPKYEGMQDELLRLMMKFQLCYALDSAKSYIAPQLLSTERPTYAWDPVNTLLLRYRYGFMPKGLVTRFIVATHHLIAADHLVWKTGVVVERGLARAEIIEDYVERRIHVRVSGDDRHALLAIVDEQLDRLHRSFPRLQCDRYLPCPCGECSEKAEPYPLGLEDLERMAKKGQDIQCYESGRMINAARLIRKILPGRLFAETRASDDGRAPIADLPPPSPEVFVSYAWTPESNALVDRVQDALQQHGVRLRRDREEVRYKDSIREFMKRIGQGQFILVVISEKYLKSENCMFELLEIAKAEKLRERIFPIVLPDANLYKATGRVRYVKYWEAEITALDADLKGVRGDNLIELQADLTLYTEIRRLFDGIAGTLRDMNALTPDEHEARNYDDIVRRIRAQIGPASA
jgi:internalin A